MLINNNSFKPHVSIKITNQTIVLDYDGRVVIFGFATMSHLSNNTVRLTIYDDVMNNNTLIKFFSDHLENTSSHSPVSTYKRTIRVVMNDFSLTMYGGFISEVTSDISYNNTNHQIEVELSCDHQEYKFGSTDFNNYIVYLRRDKIRRIQERMKKESECLEIHYKESEC